MTDIVKFLAARLDEREQIARQAVADLATYRGDENMERWSTGELFLTDTGEATSIGVWFDNDSDCPVIGLGVTRPMVGEHIALHDPAWVLADVAAKRQLLTLHGGGPHECPAGRDVMGDYCEYEDECLTLRLLALADADHPNYRKEWRL